MVSEKMCPDYIFESSWEVCNKVGGIYTVLSTRAKTLQDAMPDKLIFIGPDFWAGKENPLFIEDATLWADWKVKAENEGLHVRTGRWNIPGKPCVILVDFNPFYTIKNDIYAALWNEYQVDSLHAYGDYDEASMFSYAAGRVVECFYQYYLSEEDKVVYQAHEWMTGLGALYVQKHVPEIATIFTTHATSIGRSIAGNNKPLYDYLFAYNGNQMADELNMQSKHSIERQTAHNVDCFTTVSDVTDNECRELLDKPADAVLMNGFESNFVPKGVAFTNRRKKARAKMLQVANALLGTNMTDDVMIVATSGRYEFKNKGIDVYLEALNRSLNDENLQKEVLAFVEVPGWMAGPREDLQERLAEGKEFDTPLENPFITHRLHDMANDHVTNMLKRFNMQNRPEDKVKVIFVPCYLDGVDGIFNIPYYDLLIGNDLCVYPSYYEPWGYTPLESVAFHIPCVTTSLSGFGMWANTLKGGESELVDGVKVINRTDYNYSEVAEQIKNTLAEFSAYNEKEVKAVRKKAALIAEKALWKNFITYYYDAYDIALRNAAKRMQEEN
ncbi:MAG: glycogen/starch synthase [Paraprevotella sp.]|nr:glycogen/starch synthase [Paraprevotella sp.]